MYTKMDNDSSSTFYLSDLLFTCHPNEQQNYKLRLITTAVKSDDYLLLE
jgi:hypothetical protein